MSIKVPAMVYSRVSGYYNPVRKQHLSMVKKLTEIGKFSLISEKGDFMLLKNNYLFEKH